MSQWLSYILSCYVILCHGISYHIYHIILDYAKLSMGQWEWSFISSAPCKYSRTLASTLLRLCSLLGSQNLYHLPAKEVKEHAGLCQSFLCTRYGSGALHFCLHSISWKSVTWPQLTTILQLWIGNVHQLWAHEKIESDKDTAFSLPK